MTKMLLRGGCVLTLGTKTQNFTDADVAIDGGVVREVGRGLRMRDAEVVDAADTIVMPGFVDTHRHAWMSLYRNLGEPIGAAALDRFEPEDIYAATMIGLLGAAEAGITTVVDWCAAVLDASVAEAALRAHADSGLRTVLVGASSPHAREAPVQDRLARIARDAGPSTTIAFGSNGIGLDDLDRVATDWTMARELGMRIFAHADFRTSVPGLVASLGTRGLLGDDVTVVHHAGLDDADLDAVAASGASVSLAPSAEMAWGATLPIQQLMDRDIRPGLGVDDERLSPGDMFAQMRATISLQHATVFDRKLAGKAGIPRLMNTRDVIRAATSDGARVAGLRATIGSLEPGMLADVITLRTDRPNIFPVNDPVGAVVWGMDTSNIDRVIVGGRVLMRDGALDADLDRARASAASARERVGAVSGSAARVAPGGAG